MVLRIEENLKFLKKKSEPVKEIDNDIKSLVLDMQETMNAANGIGLAAAQVGALKRIIIIKLNGESFVMINPSITSKKRKKDILEEGCLSIPGRYLDIKRWSEIGVKATDIEGRELKMDFKDLPARIFQHELDHLNGILIVDRIPLIQKVKNIFNKWS